MSKLKNIPKINYIIILFVLGLVISVSIPTFARYKNRSSINDVNVWNGLVADSFRKGNGTKDDPYLISNGNELAYFLNDLKTNNYKNKFVKLSNDIIINNGLFDYEDNIVTYTLSNTKFYLKNDSNEFYDNKDFLNEKIGTINLFDSLNNFQGNFDGDSHTIYGLYLNTPLFNNLEGNISNLYIDNALILGNSNVSLINGNNSNISNLLFNGKIISTKEEIKTISNKLEDINIIDNYKLDIDYNNLVSLKLKGHSSNEIILNDATVLNDFEIDLKDKNLIANKESLLTNLTYTLTYKEGLAGLINGNNIKLDNVINKGTINSKLNAGLIGIGKNINIINSYNVGNINSLYAGGLASILKGNSSISYSYNNGLVTGTNKADLVNIVYDNLSISNTFNTKDNYLILDNNGKLTINNLLYLNKGIKNSNEGLKVPITKLQDKNYLISLGFKEYDGKVNNWVYNDEYPISYIDDINNKLVSINVGTYHFEDLGYVLNDIRFNSNIAFNIEDIDSLKIKEKYYYISNKVLNKDEIENLNWIKYENIIELKDEGYYVIYAKVLDTNSKIHYINTDRIVLDKTKADVTINVNNKQFKSLNNNPNNIYFDDIYNFNITAIDNLSGIKEINYFISDKVLSDEELKNVKFKEYTNEMNITDKTKKIIYAKVLDNMDYVTIVNTDYLSIDGYKLTIDNLNINNKSETNLNFKMNVNTNNLEHKLVFNQNIPINTVITLDNKYVYKVINETNNINFNQFKEIGKGNMDTYFKETNKNIDDVKINIKFNTDKIIKNLVVSLELGEIKTLKSELKAININNSKSNLYLESNYKDSIDYNSNSNNIINFKLGLTKSNYKDTTYKDKLFGLAIKLVDSNNNIDVKHLKTIKFKLNDKLYFPNNDGIVRINLNTINDISSNLNIIVDKADVRLNGNYKFIIYGYTAYDGLYGNEISNKLEIPLTSNYEAKVNYKFNVEMPSMIKRTDRILNINTDYTKFSNSNIRISLYRKKEFTSYNQDYILIDLNNYVSGLELIKDNVYYLTKDGTNNFNLNISNLTSGGYELVFELYDLDTKIGTVSKKFIVR